MHIATPIKRNQTESPTLLPLVLIPTKAMAAASPNIAYDIPPPLPGFEVTMGLACDINEANEALEQICRPRPNSPIVGLEIKMVKG